MRLCLHLAIEVAYCSLKLDRQCQRHADSGTRQHRLCSIASPSAVCPNLSIFSVPVALMIGSCSERAAGERDHLCCQHSHCCLHPGTQLEPCICSLHAAGDSPACSVGCGCRQLSLPRAARLPILLPQRQWHSVLPRIPQAASPGSGVSCPALHL